MLCPNLSPSRFSVPFGSRPKLIEIEGCLSLDWNYCVGTCRPLIFFRIDCLIACFPDITQVTRPREGRGCQMTEMGPFGTPKTYPTHPLHVGELCFHFSKSMGNPTVHCPRRCENEPFLLSLEPVAPFFLFVLLSSRIPIKVVSTRARFD